MCCVTVVTAMSDIVGGGSFMTATVFVFSIAWSTILCNQHTEYLRTAVKVTKVSGPIFMLVKNKME